MSVDLHIDTLWKMTKYGFFQCADTTTHYSEVNGATLKAGGLDSAVFALYLPHHLECDAERLVAEQIGYFKAQKFGEEFTGYLALENGSLLNNKLHHVDLYAGFGIKYLTLTHNYDNELGCSATDEMQEGLTEFGTQVVKRCEYLGVLVDVSHASDLTAYDAVVASEKPVIASHSGCRKLLNHPRNITDTLIGQIAKTGGLVGVPFVKKFINMKDRIADHIDHIVQLVGIKHVAIGSDIDGAVLVDGANMSHWKDTFTEGLLKRGYTETDISMISGENFKALLENIR